MQIKNSGLLKILTLFAYSFYFLLNLFECYICYIGKYIIYDITFDPAFISFTLVPLIISGVYFFLLLKHYFFPIHIIFCVLLYQVPILILLLLDIIYDENLYNFERVKIIFYILFSFWIFYAFIYSFLYIKEEKHINTNYKNIFSKMISYIIVILSVFMLSYSVIAMVGSTLHIIKEKNSFLWYN